MSTPDIPNFSTEVGCSFVNLAGLYMAARVNASKDDGVDRSAEPNPDDIMRSTTCEACHLGVCLKNGMVTVEEPLTDDQRDCTISPHVRDLYNGERFGSFIAVVIAQQHITNRIDPIQ